MHGTLLHCYSAIWNPIQCNAIVEVLAYDTWTWHLEPHKPQVCLHQEITQFLWSASDHCLNLGLPKHIFLNFLLSHSLFFFLHLLPVLHQQKMKHVWIFLVIIAGHWDAAKHASLTPVHIRIGFHTKFLPHSVNAFHTSTVWFDHVSCMIQYLWFSH